VKAPRPIAKDILAAVQTFANTPKNVLMNGLLKQWKSL